MGFRRGPHYNRGRVLVDLVVENYAVVERARVAFHQGLNVLTGETGSGKSLVVDALALLFGGRASAEMVRSGSERARVSGIFEPAGDAGLNLFLAEAGVEIEDGELLLEREVYANGKSRAFAGGRSVTAGFLRSIAPYLGDIHGQNDQQQLFAPSFQMGLLDRFGQAVELAAEVRDAYEAWAGCKREIAEMEASEQERLRLADLWTFQKREIEEAAPRAGEDGELENERRVLKNVARLQESASAAYTALYDAPESAFSQLRSALRRIEELSRIDSTLGGIVEPLRSAAIAVDEASTALAGYLSRLEADPGRLDAVEERLAALDKLRRKYGSTLEQVLEFLEKVRADLEAVEHSNERRDALAKRQAAAESRFRDSSARLGAERRAAAALLEKKLEQELAALALGGTRFRVVVEQADWSPQGADRVEFLVSANAGEEPRPLDRVASGGELSRIALALKTCAGERDGASVEARTLVFDEVDAGIGGAVAETVGRRLKRLAASHQILCVTHLPQVASFADHHYRVEKRELKGRTVAEVEELSVDERRREIGRMLSGQRVTEEALRQAEQLIRMSSRH